MAHQTGILNCMVRVAPMASKGAQTSYVWNYRIPTSGLIQSYTWVTGVVTPKSGVITLVINGRGPHCMGVCMCVCKLSRTSISTRLLMHILSKMIHYICHLSWDSGRRVD